MKKLLALIILLFLSLSASAQDKRGVVSGPISLTGKTISTDADLTVGMFEGVFSLTKNDVNSRSFHGFKLHATLNTGASNANTTLAILSIDTTNTATTGVTTTLLDVRYGGALQFSLASDGFASFPGAGIFANAFQIGHVSDTTLARIAAGRVSIEGVEIATASNALTLTNKTLTSPVISSISNTGTLTLPTSTDTLVGRATTDTLTNKTIDVEAAGNNVTTVSDISIDGAGCDGATASSNWDLPTSAAPTSSCTGTTTTVGSLDFVDGSTTGASRHFRLPSGWTGAVDVNLIWLANSASTNAVRWSVSTGCVADSEAVSTGPSYNTASASNTAYTGTANQRKTTSFTSVSTTNCAAGETVWLRVERIGADAGDTLAATARLVEAQIVIRKIQ